MSLQNVNRFVDIEARVDNKGDLSNFINDEDVPVHPYQSWTSLQEAGEYSDDNNQGTYDTVIASLEQHYSCPEGSNSIPIAHSNSTLPTSTPQDTESFAPLLSDPIIPDHLADNLRGLRVDDWPLWRVRCRYGIEEELVYFLLQLAKPEHEIRSAFMRNSLRGWVYLETTMNPKLIKLLYLAPGVCRSLNDVIRKQVDRTDWLKTLTMAQNRTQAVVGDWVRVCTGIYKGDVGYVAALEEWGGVSLLLVPRIRPPPPSNSKQLKRKHTQPAPPLGLFTPNTFEDLGDIILQPTKISDGIYHFKSNTFEHGLIRKQFNLNSISLSTVSMSTTHFHLFYEAGHPTLVNSKFPWPLEWIFEEGEAITIRSTGKKGAVVAVGPLDVEVALATGEGLTNVPWTDVRKHLAPGDFIEVTSGADKGKTGWVESVNDDVAQIVQYIPDNGSSPTLRSLQHFEFHVNSLKASTVPFLPITVTQPSSSSSSAPIQSDPVPWVGMPVIITKKNHRFKGYNAIVKSVLANQDTPSGLHIEVEYTHYDPSFPFKCAFYDYDKLIEASSRWKLYDYKRPKGTLFKPQNLLPMSVFRAVGTYSIPSMRATPVPQSPASTPACSPSSSTPVPGCSSAMASPAWDPSSRTLGREPDPWSLLEAGYQSPNQNLSPRTLISTMNPPRTMSSPLPRQTPEPVAVQHPLLDIRLLDIPLKVFVTNESYKKKEMVTLLKLVEGKPSIRHIVHDVSKSLAPAWVSPKHPNPTRDNGPIVVIKGDHCGKLVQQIHHCYLDGAAIVILNVVKKETGAAPSLTQERLELEVEHLCLSIETKDDKGVLDRVIAPLREEARKRK